MTIVGGCACGAIRYRIAGELFGCGYCHCRICQRSSGAPVLVFASVARDGFVVERGALKTRRSSDHGERSFCGDCGAQIAMRVDADPDFVDIAIATLDDPGSVPPHFHIWFENHISWFDTADALIRHPAGRSDSQRP
jgi:hypothetical protein